MPVVGPGPGLLVPAILLIGLPGVYLAWRLGLLARPGPRWGILAALAVAVVAAMPFGGADFVYLKRLNLLIAAGVVLLLLLRRLGVARALDRAAYRGALGALALLAALSYLNFFSFHGERTFVHLHDVAHYYLGSKYWPELGYADLYKGMLRAEAEIYDNRFKTLEARDLEADRLVPIRDLLVASDPVKEAFTPARWADFKRDVAYFRDAMGEQWAGVLRDHGFNPPPVWLLAGKPLANLVPAGSGRGILLLCLLDPLLLLVAFAALGRSFGVETLLLALIHFCIVFGATFGWTGGAFLRYPWFLAVVLAACFAHRGRMAWAGGMLGWATALRLFPALLALPVAIAGGWAARRTRALPRRHLRFLVVFLAVAAALAGLTLLEPGAAGRWRDFHQNTQRQLDTLAPNQVGLTQVLAWLPGTGKVTADELAVRRSRRSRIYRWQLVIAAPAALLLVALLARRRQEPLAVIALGLPLLFVGLNLGAYYWAVLLLLVLVHRDSAHRLMLVFGVELACYALLLFEPAEAPVYVYRSVLLAYLFVALHYEAVTPRAVTGDSPTTPEVRQVRLGHGQSPSAR